MQEWDYFVWYLDDSVEAESLTAELQDHGRKGWELVAVTANRSKQHDDRPYVAFFKRPV